MIFVASDKNKIFSRPKTVITDQRCIDPEWLLVV